MRSLKKCLIVLVVVIAAACTPSGGGTPTPTTAPSEFNVWGLGDSQGAPSNDPARGLSWIERSGLGNGAIGMEGAGWSVQGPYAKRTIAEQAQWVTTTYGALAFVVMAGINDLGAGHTIDQAWSGVNELNALTENVVYVGIVPITQGSYVAYRNADRLLFNQLLAINFPERYVNCDSTMANENGWLKSEYSLSSTDLHLNSAGEQALADCIASHVPEG